MACGCIPIGSAVGAIPEIIDSTGLILPQKDLALLQDLLSQFLLENPKEKSILARKRILDFFSYQLRQENLTMALFDTNSNDLNH
jgi:glycosyltransferase involved in cell wall biosynthesis